MMLFGAVQNGDTHPSYRLTNFLKWSIKNIHIVCNSIVPLFKIKTSTKNEIG